MSLRKGIARDTTNVAISSQGLLCLPNMSNLCAEPSSVRRGREMDMEIIRFHMKITEWVWELTGCAKEEEGHESNSEGSVTSTKIRPVRLVFSLLNYLSMQITVPLYITISGFTYNNIYCSWFWSQKTWAVALLLTRLMILVKLFNFSETAYL